MDMMDAYGSLLQYAYLWKDDVAPFVELITNVDRKTKVLGLLSCAARNAGAPAVIGAVGLISESLLDRDSAVHTAAAFALAHIWVAPHRSRGRSTAERLSVLEPDIDVLNKLLKLRLSNTSNWAIGWSCVAIGVSPELERDAWTPRLSNIDIARLTKTVKQDEMWKDYVDFCTLRIAFHSHRMLTETQLIKQLSEIKHTHLHRERIARYMLGQLMGRKRRKASSDVRSRA
jgi:hypothetical protein